MSPTFVDDIALQPMLDGEMNLWTGNGSLEVVIETDIPDEAGGYLKWTYKVRNDMRLGDFKRLVLWKPEKTHYEPGREPKGVPKPEP